MSRNDERRRFLPTVSRPSARPSRPARGERPCRIGRLAYVIVGLAAIALGWNLHPLLSRALPSIDFAGPWALALVSTGAFALGLGAAAVCIGLIQPHIRRCSGQTLPPSFRR